MSLLNVNYMSIKMLRLPSIVTGNKPSCHQPVHGSCDKHYSKHVAPLPLDGGGIEKISYIVELPNEILQKILTEALLSSGFSWPSHVCQTYNVLKDVSVRFCHITSRLAWTLPSIHFATGGKAGILKRVLARRDWKNAYLKL